MKCTDFWQKERILKTSALEELNKALEAHNHRYSWCDEDGEIPEDVETPCICVFLDNVGPTDVNIKEVIHDNRGWWFSCEEKEYGGDITFYDPYEICDAFSIQIITEMIPETKKVKDVTIIESKNLRSHIVLDSEDLAMRGFDGKDLTEEQFEQIGAMMLDYYQDGEFYEDMEGACFELGVPRLNEND